MESVIAALSRMLEPISDSGGIATAQFLADYRVDGETQARLDELGEKCNQGTLSPEERSEYEALVDAGTVIAILKGRARQKLVEAGVR